MSRSSTNRVFSQTGFHHIALRARDYDKSLAFYTEGMGFPVAHSWGEGNGWRNGFHAFWVREEFRKQY